MEMIQTLDNHWDRNAGDGDLYVAARRRRKRRQIQIVWQQMGGVEATHSCTRPSDIRGNDPRAVKEYLRGCPEQVMDVDERGDCGNGYLMPGIPDVPYAFVTLTGPTCWQVQV